MNFCPQNHCHLFNNLTEIETVSYIVACGYIFCSIKMIPTEIYNSLIVKEKHPYITKHSIVCIQIIKHTH